MKKTITQVGTEPRIWEGGQYGPLAFIKVTFDDESQGDVACKPDNAENVIGILNGLRGKESEFQLEAKDDYNNIKQFKITGYPGKPGQQDGQRPFGGGGGRQRHDPETNASIEAQVAAKIAGDIAVALIQKAPFDPRSDDWEPTEYVVGAIPRILAAIRDQKSESGSRPPDGPSPTPDSDDPPKGGDEAEGEAPGASPSGQNEAAGLAPGRDTGPLPAPKEDLGWGTGPMTAKQKAKLNMLYGNVVTKAAREMFPEVTKVGDITETMAAALIEDKGQE